MSEEEYDMMDELYFVQPFSYLKEVLNWDDKELLTTLHGLYRKGLVKCLSEPDEEIFQDAEILKNGRSYYYLATKKGLMEHNTL
ncbi:hypothetical protein [Echinicola rosea]|uniref:Uncharacterized protein n=1 Tax=Echinicola rosea TaxID=1807691 RepID=A0ABQ1UJD4_9BACT|nr:hypothetical protein [Echinicola rosea]GGF19556.1 hypothetical protein GCM10011339_04470 [Echinicola rosea]